MKTWPMHGMHGTLDPDLEVQRTIKRADLTALRKNSGGSHHRSC